MALRTSSQFSNADLIEEKIKREARRNFLAFRRYIDPKLKMGWFVREVTNELQGFYDDWMAGKRPTLVIQAPPQHGKSQLVIDFVAWVAGKDPDKKTIYSSFSERLGVRANLRLQRMYDSERYKQLFPDTRISGKNAVTISSQTLRNREIIEYVARDGFFRNTTINGQITGESLDLGIIDDPIKGRKEASSVAVRNATWDWLNDDFFTRFSDHGAMLVILTRWHIDDPVGRLLEADPKIKVLTYKAIAEEDETHRKKGDALFPEHKSLEFLLIRRKRFTNASWQSIYQQNPIAAGLGLFAIEKFTFVDRPPADSDILMSVRYWDKAATEGGGAFTAGVLMHKLKDGRYFIEDVTKGKWSSLKRNQRIKQTAEIDGKGVQIWLEQEPGSGGKESAEYSVRELAGWVVHIERVTGKKEDRADPYAAQVEGGNILLPSGRPWVKDFVSEHELFPNGRYKDQVDAAGGAFNKLTGYGEAGAL